MADLPSLPLEIPDLSQLNLTTLDVVLLGFLLLYGLDGVRRGLIAGTLALAGIFATIYVALMATQPVAELLQQTFPTSPLVGPGMVVVSFILVVAIAQFAFGFVARTILGILEPIRRLLGPLRVIEHLLGFVPGVGQGLLISALILTPLYVFSVIQPLNTAVDQSAIAGEITRRAIDWSWPLETLLGRTAAVDLPLPSRVVRPGEEVRVPRTERLSPDDQAEAKMLQLLNAERLKAGLRPLVADEALRQVAREHSQEMFRLGYFSHTSPQSGAPVDRLQRHGITFALAGENLAYAPTVEMAHAGLMASPGHRRNILGPDFTRVGIGVIHGRWVGRMFTQNFAG
jgi:uncharacterized protein YkwD/uncharacterized membrane protein required for colicin V production